MLAITGGIGLFLGLKSILVFRELGWSFFTTQDWNPETGQIGIAAVLVGTLECAAVAIFVAFPLALGLALYISEYAAPGVKRALISLVDLMAAIPSVVFGLWGVMFLMPRALFLSQWLSEQSSEVTIVIVTHNMQQAARVSDYCAFFLAEENTPGHIVESAPTDIVFNAPVDARTSDYVHGRFG